MSLTPVPTTVMWDAAMTAYYFGDYHPMNPSRLDATARLARDLGIFDLPQVDIEIPEVASDRQLELAHSPSFIDAVKRVSEDPTLHLPECGLGTEDTPAYEGIHDASARLAGGSYRAADLILAGKLHIVNFGGGMHHASRDKASGFCVYNDCAVAIARLLEQGVKRVAYIDVDAHHGDGTQSIFWDDPRVMTVSMHETGMTLFPGTGFANEVGPDGLASGTSVNVALPADAGDSGWLRTFNAAVEPLVREFRPETIVSQHGCDSHFRDDMSHLKISVDAQRQVAMMVSALAHELCEDRWIATGGGGYNLYDVVPRSWTHLMAVVAGNPLPVDTPVPGRWQQYMLAKYGTQVPALMGDEVDLWWSNWELGFDPADPVDRTIMATRKEVFPHWGLDPWYD
ncbi:acetoin utilization protein AcuC [Rothia sp. ZJ932]|uniref:acetoin utilization protein AcuC n=1 Tax=Rothia sp. ZJ932 TaxID=2810516 RepID=UPI001F07D1BF|nr:acetoin utilization protein AcuC [Rothia sp. ZJ932]